MTRFKLLWMLAAMLMTGTLSACDNDGDDDGSALPRPYASLLVGTWECYKNLCDGEWETITPGEEVLIFRADGTGSSVDKGNSPDTFTYRLNGQTLLIAYDSYSGSYQNTDTYEVVALSESELVTTRSFNYSKEGKITEYWRRLR